MSFPISQNARGFNHQGGWKMDDIKYNPKQKRILEGKFQKISKLPLFYKIIYPTVYVFFGIWKFQSILGSD